MPHEWLDVTDAEFERNCPPMHRPDTLPQALADLSDLLVAWHAREPVPCRTVPALQEHPDGSRLDTEYHHPAYQAPRAPLLGDAQTRPPWRVEWSSDFLALADVNTGQPIPGETAEKNDEPLN